MLKHLITAALLAFTATSAQAFTVTIEEASVQKKATGNELFVVDFNDLTTNSTDSFTRSSVSSSYTYGSDLIIRAADQHGGAEDEQGIASQHIESTTKPGTHSITMDQPQKYFGLWWSAGDSSNILTFLKDGEVMATFNTQDVMNKIAELPNGSNYYCNPTTQFNGLVCTETYAFLNFFFEGNEDYDEIRLQAANSIGNFESDNHTFSVEEQTISGTLVVHVPPAIVYID